MPVCHASVLIFDVHQWSSRLNYLLHFIALSFCTLLFGVPCSGFVRRCQPRSVPCVAPRGSSHSQKGSLVYIYMYMYKCVFLTLRHLFLFRPRVFPRAFGPVARREPARTTHESLGPGRSSWQVLWGFKVASPLGEGFRARRTIHAHENPRTGQNNVQQLTCDI